jgi:lactoylglutathione lyase
MPEAGRLGWVIVYVPDVEEAVAFYERAFGLARRFVVESGEYGELDTGSTALAFASEALGGANFAGGCQRPEPGAAPFNVEIVLVFDDVDAAYEHALASGCTSLAPPAHKPQGQDVAYVRDPFGTLVEIASPLG